MVTQPNSTSLPAWAPQGFPDWAPLAVSAAVILIMVSSLFARSADETDAVSDGKAGGATETAPALPPLNAATPALAAERIGTLRLVPTAQLPPAKQPTQADTQCPRPSLANPSPPAKAAMAAGWHVSADVTVNGFQFVMVDAGVEKASAGCAAIGASALIFNAEGLIAIAYDRNSKPSSRLGSLAASRPGILKFESLQGPLAELSVSDQQIGLMPLAPRKRSRALR